MDCGTRTNYGAEAARVPEPRCIACRRRYDSDRRVDSVLSMLDLRRQGMTNVEVAARLDANPKTVRTEMNRLRALGFKMPAAPYRNAQQRTDFPVADEATYSLCRALISRSVDVPRPLMVDAA
jgi:hypothetical protein